MYSVLIDLLDQYLHKEPNKYNSQPRKPYITVSSIYAETPRCRTYDKVEIEIEIYCVKNFISCCSNI